MKDRWLSLGLIDIQINGALGVDFNRAEPEAIIQAVRGLAQFGLTACCPTVITDQQEKMVAALERLAAACAQDELVAKMAPYFHVEGPFISSTDGPRGAHPVDWVRLPCYEEYCQWQKAAAGRVKIVTLAPELYGAIDLIRRLTAEGIIVSIGHSDLRLDTSKQIIDQAVAAGAHLATHLWNGCHRDYPRHLGSIGRLLSDDRVVAGFIADGIHIHPDVLKISFRTKGINQSILVTDAISGAGLPDGSLCYLGNQKLQVKNGAVRLPGDEVLLAGSALTIDQAVLGAIKFGGIELEDALQMASSNPARLLGLDSQSDQATGIIYQFDQFTKELTTVMTIVDGTVVYRR